MKLFWITLTIAVSTLFAQQQPPSVPPLNSGYGQVHFTTSTPSPQARQYFEQGMALYYGFNHEEAGRGFRNFLARASLVT